MKTFSQYAGNKLFNWLQLMLATSLVLLITRVGNLLGLDRKKCAEVAHKLTERSANVVRPGPGEVKQKIRKLLESTLTGHGNLDNPRGEARIVGNSITFYNRSGAPIQGNAVHTIIGTIVNVDV